MKHTPEDSRALGHVAYEAVKEFGGDVGNLRVSSSAIELDLLLDSKTNLAAATRVLEQKLGPLLTLRELDTLGVQMEVEEAIREGVELFNEERYWESHEALEVAWRKASGAGKEVLQGIILLAAALVHLQKNETAVALGVLGRAKSKLSGQNSEYFGINIKVLEEKISRMLTAGRPEFIKIEVKS